MDNQQIMNKTSPHDLVRVFMQLFKDNYGSIKLKEIHHKMSNNDILLKYVKYTISSKTYPESTRILDYLNNSIYFMFSKAETLCCAAIMIVSHWYDAATNSQKLDDKKVSVIMSSIISSCELTKIQTPYFFIKYYNVLKSI